MLKRTALALLLLALIAACDQQKPPTDTTTPGPNDLDTATSAVVQISGKRNGVTVRGSGFVVGLAPRKATIITASHVIEGVEQLRVTFAADRTESFAAGTVLGMEEGNPRGLAVFPVRGDLPAGVTMLSFETESQLHRGEEVFLLGFPEMAQTPLALRRTFAGPDGNFLQLDLPAGEGISGSPVLRARGGVLGVVVAADGGIAFAVKALVARDAVLGWGGSLGSQGDTTTVATCIPGQTESADGITYVRICPGTFIMGSAANDPQAYGDEKPAHQVTLSEEFWLGQTEVTNAQYRSLQPDLKGEDSLPAASVTWSEAKEACERFGGRLPTEAEWEYAARAGSTMAWSFGGDEARLGDYAWHDKNAGGAPHLVATKKPNDWDLYDMHGNVWEWVADWYAAYSAAAQRDPAGPAPGELRVLRGGAFGGSSGDLRSAFRDRDRPSIRFSFIGFRCVQDPRRQP